MASVSVTAARFELKMFWMERRLRCVFSVTLYLESQDCHCLLDIAPYAIERLHSVHIYPIIVFIRYKNAKQIK